MKKIYIFGCIAFQMVLLMAMAGRYEYVLYTGTPMKVLAQAVDPMDLFRGQYVALRYPISSWTGSLDGSIKTGDRVYLSLAKSASGIVDTVSHVSASKSDCQGLCVGAKLTSREEHQTFKVAYSYKGTGGTIVKLTNQSYNNVTYQYAYYRAPELVFTEWEKIRVTTCGMPSGICGISKKTPEMAQYPSYEYDVDGQIESIWPKVTVANFELDASRFYVKEWTGYSLEKLIRDGTVYANLRVGSSGVTVVESLESNGTVIR